MTRLKWNIAENVNFKRGDYTSLIFKVDNSKYWFGFCACMTTQTFKALTKSFAKYIGAKTVDIKREYIETNNGYILNNPVIPIGILKLSTGYEYRIEHDVPEGIKRKFTYFKENDLFN